MDIDLIIGDKEFKLQSDDSNFILSRKYLNKQKGVVAWQNVKYYSTLEGAIQSLLQLKLKASTAQDLNQLQEDLRLYKDQLKGLYS